MPATPPAADADARPPARLSRWLRAWRPAPLAVDVRERARVVAGAALGLLAVAALCHAWGIGSAGRWLVAPLGASTVLVFALPASPLAQPWAVVVGNTVSALAGLACAAWLPGPVWSAGLAPALAIAAMLATRSLHPPGGAVALLTVLTGVHDLSFALSPVALNSALLVAAGVAWNQATGRAYPHPQRSAAPVAGGPRPGYSEADLDAVLARYNQVLDIPRDDLRQLLEQAEWQAQGRRLRGLTCADVMSPAPLTVPFGAPLDEAWQLMQAHGVKALPVVDRYQHLMGIVTRADFLRLAGIGPRDGLGERLRRALQPTPGPTSDKPEVVGQIMTRQVRVASASRPLAELVPLFAGSGHHHVPVIGDGNRLVGMITQTDVVAALLHDTPAA